MSVSTGSATDVHDLLDKIALFAGVIGWTVNKQTADEIYLQNGTDFFNLKSGDNLQDIDGGWGLSTPGTGGSWANPGISLRASLGFDGGLAWDAQPGTCPGASLMGVFHNTNVPEYVLLSDAGANYLHVLARRDAVAWTVLMMGRLEKFATWTGGMYQAGQPVSNAQSLNDGGFDIFAGGPGTTVGKGTAVQADIDGLTDAWQTSAHGMAGSVRVLRNWRNWLDASMDTIGPADWSGRTAMMPCMCFLSRDVSNNSYSYVGYPPDVRHYVDDNMADGREFVLGADTWIHVSELAFKKVP